MDITWIIVGAIALLVFLLSKSWLFLKSSMPVWATLGLQLLAKYAVKLAETKYGSGNGEEKFEFAFDWIEGVLVKFDGFLNKVGLDIDVEEINEAIKAAWYDLNIEQINVGIKEPAPLAPEAAKN